MAACGGTAGSVGAGADGSPPRAITGTRSCNKVTPLTSWKSNWYLPSMPVPPPSSAQTLGLPKRCAAEEASLGKLLLTFHVPSGRCTASGTSWLRLSIPGTSTLRLSRK